MSVNRPAAALPVLALHHTPLPMDLTTAYRYNASMMEYYSCKLFTFACDEMIEKLFLIDIIEFPIF